MQKKKTTGLVWFKNNLRVRDNKALHEAVVQHEKVVGIYHLPKHWIEQTPWGFKKMERFRAQFLIETLTQLQKDLAAINISLWVTLGDWKRTIVELQDQLNAKDIYSQKEWTQEEVEEINEIPKSLKIHAFYDQFLFHPDDIPMKTTNIPEVFTVFRKKCEKHAVIRKPVAVPRALLMNNVLQNVPKIPTLSDLGYEKITHDSRTVIPFVGGEKAAWARIEEYFWETQQLSFYKKTRNGLLGKNYSSKLSLWLGYGSLSAREIYEQVKRYEENIIKNDSTYWLIFELIWRDYFKYISLKHGNAIFKIGGILKKSYSWDSSKSRIQKWIEGNTPEPFVNANMRELATTGFMSNRGRQNVASFFSKEWHLDWRIGAAYFEAMLVDYDVHSNYGNWMYNAGVGNDPRDRKFNIAWQAERYDPKNAYQKTWLQTTLF